MPSPLKNAEPWQRWVLRLEIMPSYGKGITPELVERSIARVHELVGEGDTYWTNQFGNPANAAGYKYLGYELLDAGPVDAFVMGVGTGGCISGVGLSA
jgi:cysteine synthase